LPQADPAVLTPLTAMVTDVANALGPQKPIAQQTAIKAAVDALIQYGLIPQPAMPDDDYALALALGAAQNRYSGLQITGITRFIASVVANDTDAATGIVNWNQIQSDVNALVTSWTALGLVSLPANLTAQQLDGFILALAHIVDGYNAATG